MSRRKCPSLKRSLGLAENSKEYKSIVKTINEVSSKHFNVGLTAAKQTHASWAAVSEEIFGLYPQYGTAEQRSIISWYIIRAFNRRRRTSWECLELDESKIPDSNVPSSSNDSATPPQDNQCISVSNNETDTLDEEPSISNNPLANKVYEEIIIPDYPRPVTCLVPPRRIPQIYELYIQPLEATNVSLIHICTKLFKYTQLGIHIKYTQTPMNTLSDDVPLDKSLQTDDVWPTQSPTYCITDQINTTAEAMQIMDEHTPSSASDESLPCHSEPLPLVHYHPDIYNFLNNCDPPITHLLPKFAEHLELRDLEALMIVKGWSIVPNSYHQYFNQLVQNGHMSSAEADSFRKGLEKL